MAQDDGGEVLSLGGWMMRGGGFWSGGFGASNSGEAGLLLCSTSDERQKMESLHDGQCGLCSHFGENHQPTPALVNILSSKQGNETMLDECGHPRHAALHLKVSVISGCDGFVPAARA